MKRYVSFLVSLASSVLILGGLSWAQCPEDQNDLGDCDSLIVYAWDADECYSFPCTVHFSLFVTHDSNTFWWHSEQTWVQDSIAGFMAPLKWYHSNPSAYCSASTELNTNSYTDTANSVLRHFKWKHNRMMDLRELGGGLEWSTVIVYIGNYDTAGHCFLALIPSAPQDRRWWEGDRTLLATLTFTVSDTMTVCIDTVLWLTPLTFTRHDAVVYYPRHYSPFICTTVKLQTFIRGDANGNGEVHIEDIVYLINYLFLGGSAPRPLEAGDANCDEVVDIGDLVYLINYLFLGGPPPGCP
jgi:hypothetical protein